MNVLSRRTLDGRSARVYKRSVDDDHTPLLEHTAQSSTAGRKRRRPPSLPEQQRRTARITTWADTWKELKRLGRWN